MRPPPAAGCPTVATVVDEDDLDDADEDTQPDLLVGDRIYCVILKPEATAIRATANISQRLAEAVSGNPLTSTYITLCFLPMVPFLPMPRYR